MALPDTDDFPINRSLPGLNVGWHRGDPDSDGTLILTSDEIVDYVATQTNPPAGYGLDTDGNLLNVDTDIIADTEWVKDYVSTHGGENNLTVGYGLEENGTTLSVDTDVIADTEWVRQEGVHTSKFFKVETSNGVPASASATGAVAIGIGAVASGNDALAIGDSALAPSSNSVALGQRADAQGLGSVALGSNAETIVGGGVAIGLNVVSNGSDSVALGANSTTQGEEALAAGQNAHADSDFAVALGKDTRATGYQSVAIGDGTTASGVEAVAIGAVKGNNDRTVASGDNSLAIGSGAEASGRDSIAIGEDAEATDTDAIAIGDGVNAHHAQSIALGNGASTDRDNQFVLGGPNTDTSIHHIKTPHFRPITGTELLAVDSDGDWTLVPNDNSLQDTEGFGVLITDNGVLQTFAVDTDVIADTDWVKSHVSGENRYVRINSTLGDATATGGDAIAIGPEAEATGGNAIAIGHHTGATANDSIHIGSQDADGGGVDPQADRSIAVGYGALVAGNATDSIALGVGTDVTSGHQSAIALGNGAQATRSNMMRIGSINEIIVDSTYTVDSDYSLASKHYVDNRPGHIRNLIAGTGLTKPNDTEIAVDTTVIATRAWATSSFSPLANFFQDPDGNAVVKSEDDVLLESVDNIGIMPGNTLRWQWRANGDIWYGGNVYKMYDYSDGKWSIQTLDTEVLATRNWVLEHTGGGGSNVVAGTGLLFGTGADSDVLSVDTEVIADTEWVKEHLNTNNFGYVHLFSDRDFVYRYPTTHDTGHGHFASGGTDIRWYASQETVFDTDIPVGSTIRITFKHADPFTADTIGYYNVLGLNYNFLDEFYTLNLDHISGQDPLADNANAIDTENMYFIDYSHESVVNRPFDGYNSGYVVAPSSRNDKHFLDGFGNFNEPKTWIRSESDTPANSDLGIDATAIGAGSIVSGEQATAVGKGAIAAATQTIAIGYGAQISNSAHNNSIVLGAGASGDSEQLTIHGINKVFTPDWNENTDKIIQVASDGHWSLVDDIGFNADTETILIGREAASTGGPNIVIGARASTGSPERSLTFTINTVDFENPGSVTYSNARVAGQPAAVGNSESFASGSNLIIEYGNQEDAQITLTESWIVDSETGLFTGFNVDQILPGEGRLLLDPQDDHEYCIALGTGATSTTDNQLVIGSETSSEGIHHIRTPHFRPGNGVQAIVVDSNGDWATQSIVSPGQTVLVDNYTLQYGTGSDSDILMVDTDHVADTEWVKDYVSTHSGGYHRSIYVEAPNGDTSPLVYIKHTNTNTVEIRTVDSEYAADSAGSIAEAEYESNGTLTLTMNHGQNQAVPFDTDGTDVYVVTDTYTAVIKGSPSNTGDDPAENRTFHEWDDAEILTGSTTDYRTKSIANHTLSSVHTGKLDFTMADTDWIRANTARRLTRGEGTYISQHGDSESVDVNNGFGIVIQGDDTDREVRADVNVLATKDYVNGVIRNATRGEIGEKTDEHTLYLATEEHDQLRFLQDAGVTNNRSFIVNTRGDTVYQGIAANDDDLRIVQATDGGTETVNANASRNWEAVQYGVYEGNRWDEADAFTYNSQAFRYNGDAPTRVWNSQESTFSNVSFFRNGHNSSSTYQVTARVQLLIVDSLDQVRLHDGPQLVAQSDEFEIDLTNGQTQVTLSPVRLAAVDSDSGTTINPGQYVAVRWAIHIDHYDDTGVSLTDAPYLVWAGTTGTQTHHAGRADARTVTYEAYLDAADGQFKYGNNTRTPELVRTIIDTDGYITNDASPFFKVGGNGATSNPASVGATNQGAIAIGEGATTVDHNDSIALGRGATVDKFHQMRIATIREILMDSTYGSDSEYSLVTKKYVDEAVIPNSDTTYTLEQNGHTITLVGSDGTRDSETIPDSDTTYSLELTGQVLTLVGSDGSRDSEMLPANSGSNFTSGYGINAASFADSEIAVDTDVIANITYVNERSGNTEIQNQVVNVSNEGVVSIDSEVEQLAWLELDRDNLIPIPVAQYLGDNMFGGSGPLRLITVSVNATEVRFFYPPGVAEADIPLLNDGLSAVFLSNDSSSFEGTLDITGTYTYDSDEFNSSVAWPASAYTGGLPSPPQNVDIARVTEPSKIVEIANTEWVMEHVADRTVQAGYGIHVNGLEVSVDTDVIADTEWVKDYVTNNSPESGINFIDQRSDTEYSSIRNFRVATDTGLEFVEDTDGRITLQTYVPTPDFNIGLSGVVGNRSWFAEDTTDNATVTVSAGSLTSVTSATVNNSATGVTINGTTITYPVVNDVGTYTLRVDASGQNADLVAQTDSVSRSWTVYRDWWFATNQNNASSPFDSGVGRMSSNYSNRTLSAEGHTFLTVSVDAFSEDFTFSTPLGALNVGTPTTFDITINNQTHSYKRYYLGDFDAPTNVTTSGGN